jgi:hypothetical protein
MATTAGAITQVSIGSTTASLVVGAATAGTAPYTYQWYRSTTNAFTPGAGNIIAGATALTLNDSGLIPSTQYYYKNIAIDSVAAASTSAQSALLTLAPSLAQNQFDVAPFLGQLDMRFNSDTIAVEIDASQATPLACGAAVKVVDSFSGVPKIIGCAANSDQCIGFINYDIKSKAFNAFDKAEVSLAGNVLYLYATTAIPRFAQVTLDITSPGGVGLKVAASGATIMGFALDKANAGQLIRIRLQSPTYTVA